MDDTRVINLTRKEKKVNIEKDEKKDLFNCKQCRYKCKQEITLNKHMITKHSEHQCKEWDDKFLTFMELLKHASNQHFKEHFEVQDEDNEIHKQAEHKEKKKTIFCLW